jgi:uroporphyrinogen-III synthase
MAISHVLITRPRNEAEELAADLERHGLRSIVLPAFDFRQMSLDDEQLMALRRAAADSRRPVLIVVSPRAAQFGIRQLPHSFLAAAHIAAVGPTTREVLKAGGLENVISPQGGYSSEELLARLRATSSIGPQNPVFILAAPGGRTLLAEELAAAGHAVTTFIVYNRDPAAISSDVLLEVAAAESPLTIWTSTLAMAALAERLPPAAWARISSGQWLVTSSRLETDAAALAPGSRVARAAGPTRADIVAAVLSLR